MDAVELLRSMVAIPSLSTEEGVLARFLVDRMTTLGFDARIDEAGNAVGVLGDGPRELVLLGHMDTVPGGPPVEIRRGRLYGRGAVDAKGPLATFVMAAAGAGTWVDTLSGWRIVVIGAVEEEVASSKGARHVARSYRPDACIIGEPSGWNGVTLGYKGRLVAEVSCRQPTVHSATDEPSTGQRLVDYWNQVTAHIDRFNDGHEKVFDQLQSRLQQIECNAVGNYETGRATLGFRLPPRLAPRVLREKLDTLRGDGHELVLSFAASEAAYVGERRSPLVRAFLQALRQSGARPRLKVKTGTSDMNVVGPIWGCPIVAYGPGNSGLDHTPEEHIKIEEYLKAIAVLQATLLDMGKSLTRRAHPKNDSGANETTMPAVRGRGISIAPAC